jgi:hypothetical protein
MEKVEKPPMENILRNLPGVESTPPQAWGWEGLSSEAWIEEKWWT